MRKLVIIFAMFFLFACGGDGGDGGGGGGGSDAGATDGVTGDGAAPADAAGDGASQPDQGEEAPLVLAFVGGDKMQAYEQTDYEISVMAYRAEVFVVDVSLAVALSGAGDASLGADVVVTNESGMADIPFHSGTTLGVTYTLTVTGPGGEEVSMEIEIAGIETGDLAVTPSAHFPLEGGERLWVQVVAGDFVCGETGPMEDITPADGEQAELELDDLASPFTVEGLRRGPQYAVVALVYDGDGQPLGSGCTAGFQILPDQVTAVTLDLTLLDMALTDTYAVDLAVDLSAWIDPGLADVAGLIEGHFTAAALPGSLHDLLFAAIDEMVHTQHNTFKQPECPEGQECEACVDLIHRELDERIAAHLEALGNPWTGLSDLWSLANTLLASTVVSGTVEVTSHIYAPPEHYELRYEPVSLSFTDCAAATCSFSREALAAALFSIPLMEADMEGSVSDYDQVAIDPIVLDLDPNRLVMLVLSDILAPSVFGTNDLYQIFDEHMACAELSPGFSEDFYTCIWSAPSVMTELCDGAVTEVNAGLMASLNPLGSQRLIGATQAVTGVDADGDLVLDSAAGVSSWQTYVEGGEGPIPDGGVPAIEGTSVWGRP